MVQAAGSSVAKSLLAAALCRDGYHIITRTGHRGSAIVRQPI